jgi:DNA modification methylase
VRQKDIFEFSKNIDVETKRKLQRMSKERAEKEKDEKKRLVESREKSEKVLKKYEGEMIESVMRVKYQKRVEDTISIARNEAATKEFAGIKWRKKDGAVRLSVFPKEICQKFVKFFTKPGDTVFDPFAGHNSRMQSVFEMGRSYIGYDISEEYQQYNAEIRDKLLGQANFENENWEVSTKGVPTIRLVVEDSRRISDIEIGDFCITSPPYWQQEKYTDEAGQLYFCENYGIFLADLKEIMANVYRALKPGAYLCWNVNDFQKDFKFYNYHGDCITLLKQVGFAQRSIVIIDWGNSVKSIFVNQNEERKEIPKRHEYIIVCQKEV